MIPSDLHIRNQGFKSAGNPLLSRHLPDLVKQQLLIQRYLKLLGGVSKPEEILAMTFTRKAAGEMKGRIIKALNLAQDISPPERRT